MNRTFSSFTHCIWETEVAKYFLFVSLCFCCTLAQCTTIFTFLLWFFKLNSGLCVVCSGNSWKSSSYISELLGLPVCLNSGLNVEPCWFGSSPCGPVQQFYHPVLWSQVCNSLMATLSFWRVFHQHLRTVAGYPNYLYAALLRPLDLSKSSHISFES